MKWVWLVVAAAGLVWAQDERSTYVLGPGDQLSIHVMDMEDIGKDPVQIDMRGNINLPMAGRIHVAGMTLEQVEAAIRDRLKTFIKDPDVTVAVHEMRSQPVSVLGSVKMPGVFQVQGQKTLLEMLSLAQGLREDAGYSIRITRKKEWGKIPLEGAKEDDSGQYWVAEVGVKDILEARSPEKNIPVKPNDVITVPRGELVYVMGAVKKSGGFVLGEKEKVTVLQALAMSEGMDSYAKGGSARILRRTKDPERRLEIAVNLSKILEGRAQDVPMEADDILFVPLSGAKKALMRTTEAAISLGTGIAIYRR
jgi:polysaccharide export outer membrane protein